MIGRSVWRIFVSAVLLVGSAGAAAETEQVSQESDALWEAMQAGDLDAFGAVLDRGVLDTSAFERRDTHYVLCESTAPGREPFLRSILDHGINPDVQFSKASELDRNALACASTRNNIDAFDILLDVGADTTANLCAHCATPSTLFTITAIMPPFSSRILERRSLTSFEVDELVRLVETRKLANTHEGRPTYEWYQDVLRDYGVDGLQPFGDRSR